MNRKQARRKRPLPRRGERKARSSVSHEANRPDSAVIRDLAGQLCKRRTGHGLQEIARSLANWGRRPAGRRKLALAELSELIKTRGQILCVPNSTEPKGEQKYAAMIENATTIQAAVESVLRIIGPAAFLDERHWLTLLDSSGMLDRLGRWQDHQRTMWSRAIGAAQQFRKTHPRAEVDAVKFYGLGGSAAPHDIAREVIENSRKSSIPIEVVRADAPNPDVVTRSTLAIFASFSGNTEETLRCLEVIRPRTELLVAITRGGDLRKRARELGIPWIQLPDKRYRAYVQQPRESVCLQMTASLVFLAEIGLRKGTCAPFTPADLDSERIDKLLDKWRGRFGPCRPFRENPAKQLAFFSLYGEGCDNPGAGRAPRLPAKKIPYLMADRNLQAVLHEAATQFRERSKINVIEGVAPEDLHNSVESMRADVEAVCADLAPDRFAYIFFDSADSEPRVGLRLRVTRDLVFGGKTAYAVVRAEGETPFEGSLFLTYFNAHVTTYAAMLNGFDPLPVPTMSWLKEVMKAIPRPEPPSNGWTRVSCSDRVLRICKQRCLP